MKRLAAVAGTLALLAGCSSAPPASVDAIATTTQLGSVVGDIASCAGGTSRTLMTPGLDPHDFALSAREVADMERARLVVVNGLGLEGGMTTALQNVRVDGGRIFEVAPTVNPQPLAQAAHDHADASGHDGDDPHVWMDVARMASAAGHLGDALAEATGNGRYASCGRQVQASLTSTDAEVRRILAAIPAERRVLVTDHDALGYFASAYGFRIAGVVVPGGSTEAEPSSAELSALVDTVRSTGVRAIFSNTAVSPKLVQAVSADAGAAVAVVPLYVDSVGPAGSDASTYAAMMLHDARAVAAALTN